MRRALLALALVGWAAGLGCRQAASTHLPPPAAPSAQIPPRPLPDGVELLELGAPPQLQAVRADLTRVALRVVAADGGPATWRTADQVAQELGACAVLNGGYFDEQKRPLGLIIADGVERQGLRHADWGALVVRGAMAAVVHSREVVDTRGIDQAVQCGPRLVVDGRPTRLKPSAPAARSAVGVDGQGRVVLAAVPEPGLDLHSLAELLAGPSAEGGLGCVAAMNLDGGPSTQLAVPGRVDLRGAYPMPTHLALVPRSEP